MYSQHLTPSMMGFPSSYQVRGWYEKTRMAKLEYGEDRMMLNSVVWAQHQCDRQTVLVA